MNRITTLDINKLTPYALGFDRIFDDMFRHTSGTSQAAGYPPYNIRKEDNTFQIEIALAGVVQQDISITTENGQLIVEHDPKEVELDTVEWVHRGIALRKFKRIWTLANDVVIKGATMENGMLYITLERIIPEEKLPRRIDIK